METCIYFKNRYNAHTTVTKGMLTNYFNTQQLLFFNSQIKTNRIKESVTIRLILEQHSHLAKFYVW